jgi:hypothetical protein
MHLSRICMIVARVGRKGSFHLLARCDLLDGKARMVAYDWKSILTLCHCRATNSCSPLFVLKQGRFQGVDVTNTSSFRGSDIRF